MFEIISVASIGLGLFLLGMKFLTNGLNQVAYGKFKYLLINLNIHPLIGVLIGIIITGLLQSSSSTTVILVSLVHANLLTLYQAIPIIMGSNIGTTVTSQLLAFNLGDYAFIPFIFGIVFNLMCKNKKTRYIGETLIGFSLIFIGINMLTKGLAPLNNILSFQKILQQFGKNPILGIISGFSTISILQSSSTGVAILQTLATNKLITIYSGISIMLGMNIGTCITAIISSLSLNKFAKQTAFVHLFFNIAGVILIFPFINLLCNLSIYSAPFNPSRQIANAYTIFNVFSTLILLPFSNTFANIVKRVIK